jgi:cytochrome c peroxidase
MLIYLLLVMMKADPVYRNLFAAAFTDGKINSENMLKALSQFMVMMISSNSNMISFVVTKAGGTFSTCEAAGYALFNQNVRLVILDLTTDHSFRNNGIVVNPALNVVGRYRVTQLVSDSALEFKVPSLRNVEKTAPYMHDGRFGTLEAVLNHYSNG